MVSIAQALREPEAAHWYTKTGEPMYTVISNSTGLPRPTTLADARKLDLLPSVTSVLSVLRKPSLEAWKTEQALLAALTTPRLHAETVDQFVERVLHTERVQDQESDIAKARGTEIHSACEAVLNGQTVAAKTYPWIMPALNDLQSTKGLHRVATEQVLVGVGYAGKCDLIAVDDQGWEWVIDFKTTKKLPTKESYWEHRMQTAAYLRCRLNGVRHANVYISTVNQGEFVFHDNGDYSQPYEAFEALRDYWQIANNYRP